MALTPAVCDAVSIPVVAAGGIADGRGFAAAVALGAEGVQVGTRFLTATECGVHDAYKQKVLGAKDSDTIVTGRAGGHPVVVSRTSSRATFASLRPTLPTLPFWNQSWQAPSIVPLRAMWTMAR